jgi:hypothetical protein
MTYRSKSALLPRDLNGERIGIVPLPDGAKKPCPVCGGGFWTRLTDGSLKQIPHEMDLHRL